MELPWKCFPENFQDRFDDFSVTHTGTGVVQKDDYYPFGGSFNAYTDLSTPQQDYLYNGVRLNKTTQLYETAFRTYDPYLGRFNHVDPLAAMVPGLSPYHFGFNNPVRYSDPLGLMVQDPGIWGTGDTYASNNSQNPFDFMPKFTRTNPSSGNHWSDDNISGNPNDQAIRDYYLLSGSEFEKKYGAHQSNTVIIAGSLYIVSNTTKWIEYDGVANEKSYTYETLFTKANVQTYGGGGTSDDYLLAKLYLHFQVGDGDLLTLDMSSINFGDATQSDLGLNGMKAGDVRAANLFNAGPLNQAALAFGRVNMMAHGNDQFSIVSDGSSRFDFAPLIDTNASSGRNAGNVLGAAINYNVIPSLIFKSPIPTAIPLIFGGPFNVNFNGAKSIPK